MHFDISFFVVSHEEFNEEGALIIVYEAHTPLKKRRIVITLIYLFLQIIIGVAVLGVSMLHSLSYSNIRPLCN